MSDEEEMEESPTIISIDPGGTTGWAVLTVHPDALSQASIPILSNIEHFACGEITGTEGDQVDEIVSLIRNWSPEAGAVIIEDFILRMFSMDRELLSPVRITAGVETLLTSETWSYATAGADGETIHHRIFKQMSEQAMSTATDDRLKRWGLYREGSEHARDATRHAITFMRTAKKSGNARAKAWPTFYGRRRHGA